jgi:hypothetical protein
MTSNILSSDAITSPCNIAHVECLALWAFCLVVENDIQQETVDLHVAVVRNEAQLPKFVLGNGHARPRRADDSPPRKLRLTAMINSGPPCALTKIAS